MQAAVVTLFEIGEVVDGPAFSVEELARACGVGADWVRARVEAGVLQVDGGGSGAGTGATPATIAIWRFDSLMLVRARRIAHLESAFDADPQLAALAADLIEEVTDLRRRLRALAQ